MATTSAGLGLPSPASPAASQVTNVIISGSSSSHTPYSFETVNGSGSQLAKAPVGVADPVSIVFSENVNIAADSIKVTGLSRGKFAHLG